MVDSWTHNCVGVCISQEVDPTALQLAANDSNTARWRPPHPRNLCFIIVQWEELVMRRPSLFYSGGALRRVHV